MGSLIAHHPKFEQCPECAYDLAGIAGNHCPECGIALEAPAACPSRLTYRICALGAAPMVIVLMIVGITNWEYFRGRAIIFRCAAPLFSAWPPATAIYWLFAIAGVIGKWIWLWRLAGRDYSRQQNRTRSATVALIAVGAVWDLLAVGALFAFLGGAF